MRELAFCLFALQAAIVGQVLRNIGQNLSALSATLILDSAKR